LLASYDPVDRYELKVFPALLGLSSTLLPDASLEAPTRLTAMSGKPAGDVRWVLLMGPFQGRTASSVSERSWLRRVARQIIRSAGSAGTIRGGQMRWAESTLRAAGWLRRH